METIHLFVEWLVEFVHDFGYAGIFIMTFLESTFVPVPSEVTMIPAGYLIHEGKMNFFMVFFASIAGTIGGSYFNYWIAAHYGRRFLNRFGKYMLLSHEKMEKMDKFFAIHGDVSIFTGRLIPGLRHFISFPAGLARMNIKKFCFYTAAGGGIWMLTLIAVGYVVGGNKELVKHYMPYVVAGFIAGAFIVVMLYMRNHRRKNGVEK